MGNAGNVVPQPAGPADGAPAAAVEPEQEVAQLEQDLAELQNKLNAAKKRKSEKEARENALGAIDSQRTTTEQVLEAATALYTGWQAQIEAKLPANDRAAIKTHVDKSDQAVTDADAAVTALQATVATDDQEAKSANDDLEKLKKQYGDKQNELRLLTNQVKEPPAKIEKLKSEVDKAVAASNWRLAFYKNYRLKQALDAATQLLATAQAKMDAIETSLITLLDSMQTAEATLRAKQKKLADDGNALNQAKARQTEKQNGLESAIANVL